MTKEVRVRIAPSPTGRAHLATARAALFNFLFAKQNNGAFILRLEDTDRTRSKPEYEKDVLTQLMWLGLTWDEGPLKQSQRLAVYKKKASELKEKGLAYDKDGAIYFKVPADGRDITFTDLIKGEVSFPRKEIPDFIIIRSDGTPVYHFAVVVDDTETNISHVLRGEDHLSNTPKHILLFQALDSPLPEFGHFPIILGPDGGKLSKRHGSVSIHDFRVEGILPEALLNFAALLGWSPGEEEIVDLKKMLELFRLDRVSRHPAVFNRGKLDFLNGWYLRHLPLGELAERVVEWFTYVGNKPPVKNEYLLNVLATVQERIKRLDEVPALTDFYFNEPKYQADLLIFGKSTREKTKKGLAAALTELKKAKTWNRDELDTLLSAVVKSANLGNGDVYWPVRAALTGVAASPPPVDVLVVLGQEKSLQRIQQALQKLA